MQIQVNFADMEHSDAIEHEAITSARDAMKAHADRVTRVEVHLKDVNAAKGGIDKQCTMEARLAGLDPIVAEHTAAEMPLAIREAARKLGRAVDSRVGRLRATH